MSRLTKFLRQTCRYEQAQRDRKGNVKINDYGEILYHAPRQVKCRREQLVRDVQTNTGAILRSSTRYFLDNTVSLKAEDKLDGAAVLTVEDLVNSMGVVEGYECYV